MPLLRQGLIVLIVLVVAAGGWWLWTDTQGAPAEQAAAGPRPVPVTVVEARLDTIVDVFEGVGTTRARQSVEIISTVSGRVSGILFEAGQQISKGQPLIQLDPTLEEANLAEARAMMEDARSQLERARQLVASRTVAQARVEELQASFAAARARVAAAERRLADRVILAPFDGIVGLREVDVGSRISDTTVLTRLDDMSALQLEFQVPEMFFGQVAVGQTLEAVSTALPNAVFTGTIVARDTRIDPVARAFRVRAELPNPDHVLPPGLFMTARLALATRENAVIIPEQAVQAEGRLTYVYRIRDGKAERVDVRLGLRRVGEVEVLEGLAAGDAIVTEGLQRLRPGAPVQVGAEPPAGGPAA
ncbi:MAG: efflux RND transporter periplasmic adaptor subunit [Rhodospirillaceae bacterium]